MALDNRNQGSSLDMTSHRIRPAAGLLRCGRGRIHRVDLCSTSHVSTVQRLPAHQIPWPFMSRRCPQPSDLHRSWCRSSFGWQRWEPFQIPRTSTCCYNETRKPRSFRWRARASELINRFVRNLCGVHQAASEGDHDAPYL